MHKNIIGAWPLFFGVAMIMTGHGLLGTLLGVRANLEGFSTQTIGFIMATYFAGYMLGSHYVPKLIAGVGHIRVFAAMASLAAVSVLCHALFVSETVWSLARATTGFAYAGLYIVIESWLNNSVDNKGRGQMIALYLVILYSAMAVGQYLLNVADPLLFNLFAITACLITLALLPISLSKRPAPHFEAAEKVSIKNLIRLSPLGTFGVFASGMGSASLFAIGPLYAAQAGLSLPQISTFMAAAIMGAVLLQFPIGWLSDRFDRRLILIGVAGLASSFSFLAFAIAGTSFAATALAMFLLGGTALTLYGLSSAHTNDHLHSGQIIAASATMIMISGAGSILGPIFASWSMSFGDTMFFATMGVIYCSLTAFGVFRTFIRPPVPLEDQGDFVPAASTTVGLIVHQVQEHEQQQEEKVA